MSSTKPPKAKARKTRGKAKPVPDPKGPALPTGVGTDLIPLSMLLRYNTFVEVYMQDLDGPAAAAAAGWECGGNKKKQAGHAAALLRNPYVRTRIEQQYRSIMAKTGATVERVWEEISYIAFLDPSVFYDDAGNVKPMSELPEGARRALTGMKVKEGSIGEDGHFVERELKYAGKDAAIEKLIRLHRMADNDKMVLINGDEFLAAMEEGRQRAIKGPPGGHEGASDAGQ